jgi:tRNA/tmRNA/rRNA uracil-C5-methylase (TrmA/RlmC/RlmD family)
MLGEAMTRGTDIDTGAHPPPGDLVELVVERIGARGDGIAEHHGEPVFLPFTVPGDRVLARLGARRGGGREGRVIEWLDYGKGRADPPCAHFEPVRRLRAAASRSGFLSSGKARRALHSA